MKVVSASKFGCYIPSLCKTVTRIGGARLIRRTLTSNGDNDLLVEHLQDDNTGVAVLAMNRPQAKNALSKNLFSLLDQIIGDMRNNKEVRAVILRSAVPGIFCAGADLKERKTIKPEDVGPLVANARRLFSDIANLQVPVIAALDGGAYGGGLEMALACDIRVAADNAKLGLTETRLAIIPGAGGTQRLPRLVGIGKAKELIFRAKILSGSEAADIGLVEHVVPQNDSGDAAYEKAIEIAKDIVTKGPIAIAMAKQAIDSGMQTDISTAMKVEGSCYAQVIPTEDRNEALKAFAEKRLPIFKGK